MKFRLFQNYRQWKRELISALTVEIERTRAIVLQKCETNWPYLNFYLKKKSLHFNLLYLKNNCYQNSEDECSRNSMFPEVERNKPELKYKSIFVSGKLKRKNENEK